MKRRILAFLMSVAMVASLATVFAGAVPYAPPSIAWKDFGQPNYYVYEVQTGHAAPRMDGYVTEADGYGDPIATYAIRYCTTADKVVYDENGMRPEYKLRNDGEHAGEFYVYPTAYSPNEVWSSISSIETTSEDVFVMLYYREASSYSATGAYYYFNPYTLAFSRCYPSEKTNLEWPENLLTKGTDVYTNAAGTTPYYERVLVREKPDDWETAWNSSTGRSTKYYTLGYTSKTSANRSFSTVSNPDDKTRPPEFKPNTYYYVSDKILHVNTLFQASQSSTANVATVSRMRSAHIVLPEEVKRYARYDKNFYYEAIELTEANHRYASYFVDMRYGVSTTTQSAIMAQDNSFSLYLFKALDGSAARAVKNTACRTYTNASTNLSTAGYQAGVINKYGNYEATDISDVFTRGVSFNITRQSWEQVHANEQPAEDPDVEFGEEEEEGDISSGTYGLTTYEWKIPWTVLNDNYNPYRDKTAVPHLFNSMIWIQLENKFGRGMGYLCLALTRETRNLPGGTSTSGGNYSKTKYAMRYPSSTGLGVGGERIFVWANYSGGYNHVATQEYYVTDYYSVSDLKTASWYYTNHLFYTMGQEPGEGYGKPTIEGVQIRTDDTDGQGFRIKVQIPDDITQEIEEAGVLVAPTEVSRKTGLTYGMEQIAYRAEDYAEYYGIVEVKNDEGEVTGHKWMNLCDDADTYFAASATPNDSDSFITQDVFSGKYSGLYTVNNCKLDLEADPYEESARGHYNAYVTSFTGLYDDFDDFFTFYTFRPYIKYADGTVVYGDYEYKSVYYVACWAIEEFVDAINGTVGADVMDRYTMDHPIWQAVTDADGNTVKDSDGNTVYEIRPATASSFSMYYGAADHSLYHEEERLTVFRTNAIRVLNRVNRTSYRLRDYDKFPDDFKGFVDRYVEMYEVIWKAIEGCEGKIYLLDKRK